MSLLPPPKVRKLQEALHAKAKGSPSYRFYALYDKVYRRDILGWAYVRCRLNDGAAGVDHQSFEDIEASGLDRWLDEVTEELGKRTYHPQPVRRVYIPKPDGQQRPLGIPTIKDRVVQMATVLVLEPIFEADLEPEQYAYRAGRGALDAVNQVHGLLNAGHAQVIDADLSGYFDSIPHAELMKSVSRRVSDRHLLALIAMWLESPVEEIDERGRHHRTTRAQDERRGTPQGSPISPLLSNLYIRRFVLGWKTLGHERRFHARIVNYAAYLGTRPSAKKVQRLCRSISEMTGRGTTWQPAEAVVAQLNRRLEGWANYFRLGAASRAYAAVDRHTRRRLRQWLRNKHKVESRGWSRFPEVYLTETLGLTSLRRRVRSFPCVDRVRPCPRAGCGKTARPVR
jgi:RNA-directed DNA polymerase